MDEGGRERDSGVKVHRERKGREKERDGEVKIYRERGREV